MENIKVGDVEAFACAALAIDRASGAPVPHAAWVERVYKLGFASGAGWALQSIQTIQTIQEKPCAGD